MTGGTRPGAGRKPIPAHLKKIPVGFKLPRWLVEWLRRQPFSQSWIIENAIRESYKIDPPWEKR